MIDRRPLVLTVRVLRATHIGGESVAPGEVVPMLTDDALLAVAAGRVEVVGDHAGHVRTAPTVTWCARSPSQGAPRAGEWMLAGEAPNPRRPAPDPSRPMLGALA